LSNDAVPIRVKYYGCIRTEAVPNRVSTVCVRTDAVPNRVKYCVCK
jgi:hypothetical protein